MKQKDLLAIEISLGGKLYILWLFRQQLELPGGWSVRRLVRW